MPFLKLDINPELLRWGRESIGETIGSIAMKLKIDANIVRVWESNGKEIPLGKLEQLARIYRRPFATFFLAEKPKGIVLPKDFRTLPENQNTLLSIKTRLAIRKAQRLQLLALDLSKELEYKIPRKIPRYDSRNPEVLAKEIRNDLGINIEKQFDWKEDRDALTSWIRVLEKNGILVFQMSMPVKEIRAFSLQSDGYPVIVVNVKDSTRARIFSLFHEYCHLLLHMAGVCDLGNEEEPSIEIKSIEEYCNHFAGAFLVPKEALLGHPLMKGVSEQHKDFNKVIYQVSKNFRVSREVILRRLLIFGKISQGFYKDKIREFKEEFKKIKQPSRGRWLVPYRKCLQERGAPFISMVFEAKNKGKITTRNIIDFFDIRRKHLSKLEKVIQRGI